MVGAAIPCGKVQWRHALGIGDGWIRPSFKERIGSFAMGIERMLDNYAKRCSAVFPFISNLPFPIDYKEGRDTWDISPCCRLVNWRFFAQFAMSQQYGESAPKLISIP